MAKVYSQDRLIWDNVAVADNPFTRFKGLMGRRALQAGEAMLITPCNQVHTFHMRFDLDILFITRDMRIARIVTLVPGKIGPKVKEAAFVVEVAAGSAEHYNVSPGDTVKIERGRKNRRREK